MATQRFRSTITWDAEGTRQRARSRNHEVVIDEPVMMGGTDQGSTPVEMLLAALGGCINVCVTSFAPMHDVAIRSLKTTVDGFLDPDGFTGANPEVRSGFSEITYRIALETTADQEHIDALLAHAYQACPVKDTLLHGVPVHFVLEESSLQPV